MAKRKLPAFQFYPGDWLKEPRLRVCSHATKGVFIDVLCLMFECDERGVLATAGRAWSETEIAQAVGGDQNVTLSCIRELVDRGVVSRNNSGALYSRRMVADESKRRLCGEAGKRGGGNPDLTFKGLFKGDVKGGDKGKTKSSSSSSDVNDDSLRDLSLLELQDTKALLARWARVAAAGLVKATEHSRATFVALAELALEKKDPPAFFRSAIDNQDVRGVKGKHKNRASIRLAELRQRGELPPITETN